MTRHIERKNQKNQDLEQAAIDMAAHEAAQKILGISRKWGLNPPPKAEQSGILQEYIEQAEAEGDPLVHIQGKRK